MRANCSKRSKFFAIAERTCRCNVRDSGKIFFRNPWREKEEKRGEFVTFSFSFFFFRWRDISKGGYILEIRWKKDGRCRCVWLVRILNILQWTWAVGFELFRKVSSQEILRCWRIPFFLSFLFFIRLIRLSQVFKPGIPFLFFSVLITKMFKIIKEIFAGQLVSSLARWISVYFTTIINYTGNETSRRISVLFAIQYILSKHYFLHSI